MWLLTNTKQALHPSSDLRHTINEFINRPHYSSAEKQSMNESMDQYGLIQYNSSHNGATGEGMAELLVATEEWNCIMIIGNDITVRTLQLWFDVIPVLWVRVCDVLSLPLSARERPEATKKLRASLSPILSLSLSPSLSHSISLFSSVPLCLCIPSDAQWQHGRGPVGQSALMWQSGQPASVCLVSLHHHIPSTQRPPITLQQQRRSRRWADTGLNMSHLNSARVSASSVKTKRPEKNFLTQRVFERDEWRQEKMRLLMFFDLRHG